MPGCGMQSRPKLADKARYNSLLKIKQTTTTAITALLVVSILKAAQEPNVSRLRRSLFQTFVIAILL